MQLAKLKEIADKMLEHHPRLTKGDLVARALDKWRAPTDPLRHLMSSEMAILIRFIDEA